MPDVTDLARLDEEMAPLQARLDELTREYNRVVDAVAEQTFATIDLDELRARTSAAIRKLPALLASLEEVVTVYDELSDWAYTTFRDADEQWGRLRGASGVDDLGGALEVVAGRLNSVLERDVKEGDAERALAGLDEIVQRVERQG